MFSKLALTQERAGRWLFSTVIATAAVLLFGPAVYAEFARRDGDVGWGEGYGYGFEFGNGWDGGYSYGYIYDKDGNAVGTPPLWDLRDHGFGYGRLLPRYNDSNANSFDSSSNTYEISSNDVGYIYEAGLVEPFDNKTANNDAVTIFHENVRVHIGFHSFYFPVNSVVARCAYPPELYGPLYFMATSSFSTTGLSGVRGKAAFALENGDDTCSWVGDTEETDLPYPELMAPEVSIRVGGAYNGQVLNIAHKASAGDSWTSGWGTCTISGGYCRFSVDDTGESSVVASLGYYAVYGGTARTSGGGGGGGGGSYYPPTDTNTDSSGSTSGTGTSGSDTSGSGSGTSNSGTRGGVTSTNAKTREEANRILPGTVPVDSLVKLADDRSELTTADSTVYYIGLDAKRHPFPNRTVYMSWYQDFSEVRNIDLATLSSIPLGAPILVRPGTHLVKIVSDPKTYYVEPGYSLRWIKDEQTARLLAGPDWARNVVDVDPSLFTIYSMGTDIDSAALATGWPSGAIVKVPGSSTVYYVTSSGRRPIEGEAALQANHFQMRFVTMTSVTAGWVSRTLESAITAFEDGLFSLMH